MTLIGLFLALIFNLEMKKRNHCMIFLSAFLTFYIALSFFGTFYINITPWEILFWSAIIPLFFDKRVKIKFK